MDGRMAKAAADHRIWGLKLSGKLSFHSSPAIGIKIGLERSGEASLIACDVAGGLGAAAVGLRSSERADVL